MPWLRLYIVLAVAVAGCSSSELGEFSVSECTDEDDNDGDSLNNCDDPDCQAYAHCVAQVGTPVTNPPPTAVRGDASVGPPWISDAGQIISDAAVELDAASDEDGGSEIPVPVDAGMPPCGGRCTATQACIDDMCQDVSAPTGGVFELRILTVEVPDFNMWGQCLDSCAGVPSFAFCVCAPDPYVEVWRIREEAGKQVGMRIGSTPVAINERMANFQDTVIPVELTEGDALLFVVIDDDPGSSDNTTIYRCLPDLSELAPGAIECSETVVGFLPPHTIRAELLAVP